MTDFLPEAGRKPVTVGHEWETAQGRERKAHTWPRPTTRAGS